MVEGLETLTALQLGDSFFPSGATSFSWGLETLRAEGELRGAEAMGAFVAGQLEHRWATFDRPAVAAAWRAGGDLARVCAVDREVDAATLAREAREGGRRIGSALLKVHAGMGTSGVTEYLERIQARDAYGQLPVVQGFVGHASGLGEAATSALSAYGVASGIVAAAIRMGMIGHVDAQRILLAQRARIAEILAAPVPPLESMQAYVPMAEIAMMRHETGYARLFAN
jgi:urease accessory protein